VCAYVYVCAIQCEQSIKMLTIGGAKDTPT